MDETLPNFLQEEHLIELVGVADDFAGIAHRLKMCWLSELCSALAVLLAGLLE